MAALCHSAICIDVVVFDGFVKQTLVLDSKRYRINVDIWLLGDERT